MGDAPPSPPSADRPTAWRVERATKEFDKGVTDTWNHRAREHTHQRGPVAGKLDTTLERRSARLEMLQVITKPTAEEQSLARGQSDHTLVEQMHQAARATDKLPPPLILATEEVKHDLTAAQRAEKREASRVRALNDQYHKAKAQGTDAKRLAQLDQERAKTRQQLNSTREWQRDARAEQEAIHQRTRALQQANDQGGRVLSRAIAAAKTLIERGYDLQRWAGIIAHPTRAEERAVQLGGRQTQRELAAENHTDRTRRLEAIRDRAQMGQLIASQQPAQQQPRSRNRNRTRSREGRGRAVEHPQRKERPVMFRLTTTPPPVPARPASPQVTLLCITDYLHTELDALNHTTTAGADDDAAFVAARGIQTRTLRAVLDHLWAMGTSTSRTTALTEHERRIEQFATLSPRVVLATDDENHPDQAVAGWVISSRARHAAQLRPRRGWRLLGRLAVWRHQPAHP